MAIVFIFDIFKIRKKPELDENAYFLFIFRNINLPLSTMLKNEANFQDNTFPKKSEFFIYIEKETDIDFPRICKNLF